MTCSCKLAKTEKSSCSIKYMVQSGVILKIAERLFSNEAYVRTTVDLCTFDKMVKPQIRVSLVVFK